MTDGSLQRALVASAAVVLAVAVTLSFRHGPPRGAHDAERHDRSFTERASDAPKPVTTAARQAPERARTATAVTPPSAAPSESAFDEAELMRLLQSARGNDPALAVELAREGNRRFPASPDAPERASILVHALSDQGRTAEARGEAEDMVNRYPESAWVHEIERFTGAHRHRNARVNAQGQLEFYDPPPG